MAGPIAREATAVKCDVAARKTAHSTRPNGWGSSAFRVALAGRLTIQVRGGTDEGESARITFGRDWNCPVLGRSPGKQPAPPAAAPAGQGHAKYDGQKAGSLPARHAPGSARPVRFWNPLIGMLSLAVFVDGPDIVAESFTRERYTFIPVSFFRTVPRKAAASRARLATTATS